LRSPASSPAITHRAQRAPTLHTLAAAPPAGLLTQHALTLGQPLLNLFRAFPRREERSQILNVGPGAAQQLLLGAVAEHDLRHPYASLARRAGADLRLLQKTMGHASITVTAHIYADLYDDELDDIASALDLLDDSRSGRA
jgi:integrase